MNPEGDFDVKHYVYRCFDAVNRLLYVGCTRDVGARMAVHMASGHNPASKVLIYRMVRHEVTAYATEAEAKQAEREAIFNEEPIANLHHQRVRETPAERDRRLSAYLESTRPPVDESWRDELDAALAMFGSAS